METHVLLVRSRIIFGKERKANLKVGRRLSLQARPLLLYIRLLPIVYRARSDRHRSIVSGKSNGLKHTILLRCLGDPSVRFASALELHCARLDRCLVGV